MKRNTAQYWVVHTVTIVMILAISVQSLLLSIVLAAPENTQRTAASIGGEVFLDSNFNAIREPLEIGVQGAIVVLSRTDGTMLSETVTDDEGYYSFANLDVDTYQLEIFPPAGYIVSSNGTISVQVREISAPIIASTALRFGILLPFVTR